MRIMPKFKSVAEKFMYDTFQNRRKIKISGLTLVRQFGVQKKNYEKSNFYQEEGRKIVDVKHRYSIVFDSIRPTVGNLEQSDHRVTEQLNDKIPTLLRYCSMRDLNEKKSHLSIFNDYDNLL